MPAPRMVAPQRPPPHPHPHTHTHTHSHTRSLAPAAFRQPYLELGRFRDAYPSVPLLVLSATATACVQHDTAVLLGMRAPLLFTASFDRPRIKYSVRAKRNHDSCIHEMAVIIAQQFATPAAEGELDGLQSGLVFCAKQDDCRRVADDLQVCSGPK